MKQLVFALFKIEQQPAKIISKPSLENIKFLPVKEENCLQLTLFYRYFNYWKEVIFYYDPYTKFMTKPIFERGYSWQRLSIPSKLRQRLLSEAHEQFMRALKNKGLIQTSVEDAWFSDVLEKTLPTIHVEVKHQSKIVVVRLLYDHKRDRLIKVAQGWGFAWKDIGVKGRQRTALRNQALGRLASFVETKLNKAVRNHMQPDLFDEI